MAKMIAHLKVKDYAAWRQPFDANTAGRSKAGLSNERIFRLAEDGNELILVMDAESLDRAREFASSSSRKEAMERAGVIGTPTDYFVD